MTTAVSTARTRVMPATSVEVTPEHPLSEDVQVWRDLESGRTFLAVRTAGIGVRAELAAHQADELAGALMDVTPVPYELADLDDLPVPRAPATVWVADPHPGGYVCAVPTFPPSPGVDGICRHPVESEPCPLHACAVCGAELVGVGPADAPVRTCPAAGAMHYEVDLTTDPVMSADADAGGGW